MKRRQVDAFDVKYAVIETKAESGTYVEYMPQSWIIPPKNKIFVHKERDNVKFLFPLRLPHQNKDSFIKYVKQAKFNCSTPERNEKWELKEGRILKMDIASFENALEVEKLYSDYFSSTENETKDQPAPIRPSKKAVRKKQMKIDRMPINDSESEDEEKGELTNYNITFEATDQCMFSLENEGNILDFNQMMTAGIFDSNNGNLIQPIKDTLLSTKGNVPDSFNGQLIPLVNNDKSTSVQREIPEDQQLETCDETFDEQQDSCNQTCCKMHQKVLNKIDYVQKKWSKEFSLLRQESRLNQRLLLRVLKAVDAKEAQDGEVHNEQMDPSSGEVVAEPLFDMAKLDRLNTRYKATFPITSSELIVDFNKSLKDDEEFAEFLVAKLSEIKGGDEMKTARKIFKELCDVRCMKDFTWLGTKRMKCFQDLHLIIEMISKLLTKEYPQCNAFDIITKVVKQRTKSAKESYAALMAAEEAAARGKHDSNVVQIQAESSGINKGDDATVRLNSTTIWLSLQPHSILLPTEKMRLLPMIRCKWEM